MARELVAGGPPARRSDVFALRVVLLELVSGQEPVRYELLNRGTGEYERTLLIDTAAIAVAEGMRRWVDRRLRDSFPIDAAESLTTLVLRYVAKDPLAWPDVMGGRQGVQAHLPTDISISITPRLKKETSHIERNDDDIDED